MKDNKPLKGVLWTARIYGLVIIGLLLYVAISEYIEKPSEEYFTSIKEHLNIFVPVIIAFVGLVIAYWKEGLGGGISLISIIWFFFDLQHLNSFIFMAVFSVPSVLYLIYWWNVSYYPKHHHPALR